MKFCPGVVVFLIIGWPLPADAVAGSLSTGAEETAQFFVNKFGRNAVEEGSLSLARRLEILAARHGEEALKVARMVGPGGLKALEEAGPHADEVLRLLSRYGEQGAWIAAKPGRLALFLRFGDGAADALARHGAVAEQVIERTGQAGARAIQGLNGQNARRVAMLLEEGTVGRSGEWLPVIGRYGDAAASFIWEHKGALAIGAIMATFLADPEPFINGAQKLAGNAITTAGEVVGKTTQTIAVRTNWTVVLAVAAGLVVLYLGFKIFPWQRTIKT